MGSKEPHIVDSFSLGINTFRGFDDCGIGPMSISHRKITKDSTNTDHISVDYVGAKKYWKVTSE